MFVENKLLLLHLLVLILDQISINFSCDDKHLLLFLDLGKNSVLHWR